MRPRVPARGFFIRLSHEPELLSVLLPALAASPAGALVLIVANAGPDGEPVRFEPGSLLAMAAMGEKVPAEQPIPVKTLPGQKAAPCDSELGEVAINGNCWFASRDVKPPCGRLFRHGDGCYRPIAADPQRPVGAAHPSP